MTTMNSPYIDQIESETGYPFATALDGQTVSFRPERDIHLLVTGVAGAGKTVALQTLVDGAMRHGHELYVLDATKSAEDFAFATPHARVVARYLPAAHQVLDDVRAEMLRRTKLAATHQVSSWQGLPEHLGLQRIVVVIEEFTSLITPRHEDTAAESRSRTQVKDLILRIARQGRAAGVSLVISTQKLTPELAMSPYFEELRANLSRLLVGASSASGSHPGQGVYEPCGGEGIELQVWHDHDGQGVLVQS